MSLKNIYWNNMQKIILKIFIIAIIIFSAINFVFAADNIAQKLSGKILLQVEEKGEAWYINPADLKKYYLGRPQNAFDLMRKFGLGIKHNELTAYLNNKFPERLSGKIMLDVEANGEAYYVYPDNLKGYYLGRPMDAFNIMRNLGLGITNENLNKISEGHLYYPNPLPNPDPAPNPMPSDDNVLSTAADAIRSGNTTKTLTYFTPELQKAIEYTMNFLNTDGRLTFGNILSGSKLSSENETKKIYTNKVYFGLGGYDVNVEFIVEKQADESWLISKI